MKVLFLGKIIPTKVTPEDSPRYMSDLTVSRKRVEYGATDTIYVDIYAKRTLLNKLLTYLNTKDTIANMKQESPGIDQYDTMNYTLASIGVVTVSSFYGSKM